MVINILIANDAPHGISELLVISVLQALAKENCQSVTAGPVPVGQLGEIIGLGRFSEIMTRWIYQISKRVFHLGGRQAFWTKFHPTILPSYLLFPEKKPILFEH